MAASALVLSPAAEAATVLTVQGWEPAPGVADIPMDTQLGGVFCAAPNTCQPVEYKPWWGVMQYPAVLAGLDAGTADVAGATDAGGASVIMGYSQGAAIVTVWERQHPDRGDVSLVLIGNPNRKYGGKTAAVEDNPLPTLDVARQYDPISDHVSNPWNFWARLNAAAAFFTIHTDYQSVDLSDPRNIVWSEGRTTYVFVPAEHLPLLAPMWRRNPERAAQLEPVLRDKIDAAYDHSYLPEGSSWGTSTVTSSTSSGSPTLSIAQGQAGGSAMPPPAAPMARSASESGSSLMRERASSAASPAGTSSPSAKRQSPTVTRGSVNTSAERHVTKRAVREVKRVERQTERQARREARKAARDTQAGAGRREMT